MSLPLTLSLKSIKLISVHGHTSPPRTCLRDTELSGSRRGGISLMQQPSVTDPDRTTSRRVTTTKSGGCKDRVEVGVKGHF